MTWFQNIIIGVLGLIVFGLVTMLALIVGWYVTPILPWVAAEAIKATPTSTTMPTKTPAPEPTATATKTPTPIPSITAFGETVKLEQLEIKMIGLEQVDSLSTYSGSSFGTYPGSHNYYANEGHIIYLVKLEVTNTTEADNKLVISSQQIEMVDARGKSYTPTGIRLGLDGDFLLETGTGTVMSNGHFGAGLWVKAAEENRKRWTLDLLGQGSAALTMAFEAPSNAEVEELRWPKIGSFSLKL
ncbi:MAG: hypothetical protein H6632_22305 [Anaerolineales bacterium]|nr:hypothetical protein [Anaerolineales bacterium]